MSTRDLPNLPGVYIYKHEPSKLYHLRHVASDQLIAGSVVNGFTRLRDAKEAAERVAALGLDWTPERPDFIGTVGIQAKVINAIKGEEAFR